MIELVLAVIPFVSLFSLLLVMKITWRYRKLPKVDPIDNFLFGAFWTSTILMVRLFVWSVMPVLTGVPFGQIQPWGEDFNRIFDLGVVFACHYKIKGVKLMLDPEGRYGSAISFAVFWPRTMKFPLFCRR